MTSANKKSMELSQEQKAEIEELSGLGFNPVKIAMIMNLPWPVVEFWMADPDSEFRYHYERGILIDEATRDKEVSAAGKNGSVTAIQHIEANIRKHRLHDLRERLLNGNK